MKASKAIMMSFVLVQCVLLLSCGGLRNFSYPPNAPIYLTPKTQLTVGVLPFADSRPPSKSKGDIWWIPIVGAFDHWDGPVEEYVEAHSGPMEEPAHLGIARSIALDLQQSGVFKDVGFLEGDHTARRYDCDVIIAGDIKAASFRTNVSPMCVLGFLSGPLMLAGLPINFNVGEDVDLDLRMVRPDNGEHLWTFKVKGKHRKLATGLWWGNLWQMVDGKAPRVGFVTRLLKEGMAEAIESLDKMIQERGDAYWLALAKRPNAPAVSAPEPSSEPPGNVASARPSSIAGSDRWAIVVGLSDYEHAGEGGLTSLTYADDDARAFRDALVGLGWDAGHIKCFIDRDATRNEVETQIRYGPDLKDSLFVLFWAGHGYPDPVDARKLFLACYDTETSKPGSGVRMSDLRGWLEERKAKNVVILADACHAGGLVAGRDGEDASARGLAVRMKPETVPPGWIYLLGASTTDKAIEHPSVQGGIFTQNLVRGLSGDADGYGMLGQKDGTVTLGELREYVQDRVKETAFDLNLNGAFETVNYTDSGDKEIWSISLKAK